MPPAPSTLSYPRGRGFCPDRAWPSPTRRRSLRHRCREVPSWLGGGFGASPRLDLLEAGETRLDLSNWNGVGGLPAAAANELIVRIAWPNRFGARHCEGSLQRAGTATVAGGEQILVLQKKLVHLTRDSSLGGSGELEDSCRLGKRWPLAAQAHSLTSHAITIPSRSRACQAYRARYSRQGRGSDPPEEVRREGKCGAERMAALADERAAPARLAALVDGRVRAAVSFLADDPKNGTTRRGEQAPRPLDGGA